MNAPFTLDQAPRKCAFRVEDFLTLARGGAFENYAKAELIEGEIWVVNAIHSRHGFAQFRLAMSIQTGLTAIGSRLQVATAISIEMPDSLPEPDIVVAEAHDGLMPLAKVALVIEISDTTLDIDLGRKAALYARMGIPEYWIVDLTEDRVLCHMTPEGEDYAEQIDVPFGERLMAGTIKGLEVSSEGLV